MSNSSCALLTNPTFRACAAPPQAWSSPGSMAMHTWVHGQMPGMQRPKTATLATPTLWMTGLRQRTSSQSLRRCRRGSSSGIAPDLGPLMIPSPCYGQIQLCRAGARVPVS